MKKTTILFVFILFLSKVDAIAQCAMCKAVAETSTQTGASAATGLNGGILYLMVFPYLLMGVIGYAIYRHKKLKTEA